MRREEGKSRGGEEKEGKGRKGKGPPPYANSWFRRWTFKGAVHILYCSIMCQRGHADCHAHGVKHDISLSELLTQTDSVIQRKQTVTRPLHVHNTNC